jgi:hypothetical protein
MTDTSIEIFTTEKRSYFMDFVDEFQRGRILAELKKMKLPKCRFFQSARGDIAPLLDKATDKWSSGRMSNFDYLMKLNKFAGRTYNDLGQYPVFPWVIADYESSQLDLDNPETFRNLAVPIGALDNRRLESMIERMESSEQENDKCLYHSFYSSQAVVVGYLIRMEPFTSLHIELQGGRFDISARLFSSIPKAWESVKQALMDFRELTPEFFYLPDFLTNHNQFDLGSEVNDVELPAWANYPNQFIELNRRALESPFVSAILPRWINMIFGLTSRGRESRLINNTFSDCFFPESITPEVRQDSERFQFFRDYAACFGQAPPRLMDEPAMSRKVLPASIADFAQSSTELLQSRTAILSIEITAHSMVFINSAFEIIILDNGQTTSHQLRINAEITESMIPKVKYLVQSCRGFVITGTPWDTAFTLSTSHGIPLHIKRLHTQRLSAVAIGKRVYVTGSCDCTLMLWRLQTEVNQVPYAIISKHKSQINCLAMNEKYDLVVSCLRRGEVISVALGSGTFLRKIEKAVGEPSDVVIWDDGTVAIAFTSSNRSVVVVLDQNLNQVSETIFPSVVWTWTAVGWPNGMNYVIVGMRNKKLAIYQLPGMEEVWGEQLDYEISKVVLATLPLAMIVGTMCGRVLRFPFEPKSLTVSAHIVSPPIELRCFEAKSLTCLGTYERV